MLSTFVLDCLAQLTAMHDWSDWESYQQFHWCFMSKAGIFDAFNQLKRIQLNQSNFLKFNWLNATKISACGFSFSLFPAVDASLISRDIFMIVFYVCIFERWDVYLKFIF
jgi:hypothetical protein